MWQRPRLGEEDCAVVGGVRRRRRDRKVLGMRAERCILRVMVVCRARAGKIDMRWDGIIVVSLVAKNDVECRKIENLWSRKVQQVFTRRRCLSTDPILRVREMAIEPADHQTPHQNERTRVL